ncbi:unnamed protein product [Triticum turgidum subsp. durum]|uniref:Bowman-Birk serine protease inhibitors family domain-containing protein n=1 Tax=Triticum turgidum subsp. durum TaxID=4567 RepID=A0A9R1Q767_TRITD|nr:unnamed protein product [Triticum turgidum subsp. durum]
MKMSCIVRSILLLLSLEAALLVAAGRPSTATGTDNVGAILLPSEGKGQAGTVATRPWKCCDRAFCTKSFPPMCRCMDMVEQCAATCKKCEPATSDSSRRVCNYWYHGFPGPKCTEAVATAKKKKAEGEEERPWKCCDMALCTRSFPPMCRCMDKVEQCASNCKSCDPASPDSSRRVCNDWYHGFPGAKCTAGGN